MDILSKADMNEHYGALLAQEGPLPAAMAYKERRQQIQRYASLTNIEPIPAESSVLDVGSGLGHLCGYLRGHGWKGEYTGIDINSRFIAAAQDRLPDDNFMCTDILEDEIGKEYDYVFCGATVQHRPKYCDPQQYLEEMVRAMFGLARKGVAFDVFSDRVDYKRDDLLHVVPTRLLNLCYSLTTRVALHNEMRPYEIVVYLYKETEKDHPNIYCGSCIGAPVIT